MNLVNTNVEASEEESSPIVEVIDGITYTTVNGIYGIETTYFDEANNKVSVYFKSDGNVYMNTNNDNEILAVVIESITLEEQTRNELNARAGSEWLLKSEGYMKGLTITGSVVDAGKAAVLAGLKATVFRGVGITRLTSAGLASLSSLADYIVLN